jgi:rhomboid family GlyGly-CTERM serine protease
VTTNVRKSFHFHSPAQWRKACWLAAAAGLPILLLMLLPAQWQQLLRYERLAVVQQGEWWRLPASQWLHLGWSHALLNASGWLLLCLLLVPAIGAWRTVMLLGAAVAGTATGLLLHPQLGWYVGLSGALHGVLAGGML